MKKLKLAAFAVSCAALIAGCSSPKHEPADLVKFTPAINVTQVWSKGMSSSPGFMVPAVVDDSVWVAGGKTLTRLDARTGESEWSVSFDEVISAGVGSDGYVSAVGLENGELAVLDGSGKVEWKTRLTTELAGPPVVAGGLVIVRTRDMRISAFEGSTGDPQWSYQRNQPALTVRLPVQMIARDNLLIVGQANGHVVILDIPTGRPVFEFTVAQAKGITEVERLIDVVGAPALVQDMLCAAAYQGAVTCVDTQNGRLKWSKPVDAVSGPLIDEDNVYVVDAVGKVYAFYRESGEQRWENATMTYRGVSAPVGVSGAVVVGDSEGYLHFLSPRTGEEIARSRMSGSIVSPGQSFSYGAVFQSSSGDVAYLTTR